MNYPGPGNFYVTYDYDTIGQLTAIREQGASSGVGVLASYGYDDLGRRTALNRGDGADTTYGFDNLSRLTDLDINAAGSGFDLEIDFSHNPAGQIVGRSRSNAAYDWVVPDTTDTEYTSNALNQITDVDGVSLTYEERGHLTDDGANTYSYNAYGQLIESGSTDLTYDPAGRLHEVEASSVTRFLYDGPDVIAELDGSGNVLRRGACPGL